MKIGELAKKTGCQTVTIRYYEKEGLLTQPERSQANYRVYGEEDLERLEFIIHCRKHDMKLEEIRRLLSFRDNPGQDCTWVNDMIDHHVENVEKQIHSLLALRGQLLHLRSQCAGGQNGDDCGIMQSLEDRRCCRTGEKPH